MDTYPECPVQPSVAVRCAGQLVVRLKDDAAIEGEAREHSLLKHHQVLLLQTKVRVACKEVHGGLLGVL